MEESVKLFSSSQHLEMAQVGHFNNKVVYARVMDERGWLDRLWKSLRHGCQAAGIPLIDGDTFTPHVTILKLSRDRLLYRKVIVQPRGKKKKISLFLLIFPGDQGCGFASVRKSRGTRIRPTGTTQSLNFLSEKQFKVIHRWSRVLSCCRWHRWWKVNSILGWNVKQKMRAPTPAENKPLTNSLDVFFLTPLVCKYTVRYRRIPDFSSKQYIYQVPWPRNLTIVHKYFTITRKNLESPWENDILFINSRQLFTYQ